MTELDSYRIKSEQEWKEILSNHNTPYYPRHKDLEAEETYCMICSYFVDRFPKPTFLNYRTARTIRLEKQLLNKKRQLETIAELSKFEKAQILMDIKLIEKKLGVRR